VGRNKKMGQKEDNLKKLSKTGILANFVKRNKGAWDHAGWLSLLEAIKEKGYFPIDEDQVGLLLEQKKAAYKAKK
jgi:hypothetical protein